MGVATTCISGNSTEKEGSILVRTDKFGNFKTLSPTIAINNSIIAHSGNLIDRFDDVRYYTGDAVT